MSQSSETSASVSRTSTVFYEQEPFHTFEALVKTLCTTTIWPFATNPETITIQRMRGGSYNRVIGINVSSKTAVTTPEGKIATGAYVLRIPRGKVTRIEQELATLSFLRDRTTIPVPTIIEFDLTSNNPINGKYSLQQRIPGSPLYDVYMKISQSERLAIVHQLAHILLDIQKLDSPTPGLLEAAKLEAGNPKLVPEVRVVDFQIKTFMDFAGDTLWGGMEDDLAKPKSTFQLLIDQFNGWQKFGQKCNRGEEEDELIERFREVTRQMNSFDLLPETPYILFHPDFAPQNILVHKLGEAHEPDEISEKNTNLATAYQTRGQVSHQSEWEVSGILDWDGAAFVPPSVACTPPSWLWSDWNTDEEDDAIVYSTPDDPEAQERKELFDSIMGSTYTDFAYSDDHRFVRRLFEFAMEGFTYSHRYDDAAAFLEEWEKKVPEISENRVLELTKELQL